MIYLYNLRNASILHLSILGFKIDVKKAISKNEMNHGMGGGGPRGGPSYDRGHGQAAPWSDGGYGGGHRGGFGGPRGGRGIIFCYNRPSKLFQHSIKFLEFICQLFIESISTKSVILTIVEANAKEF